MSGVFRSTGLDDVWSGFTGKGTSEDRSKATQASTSAQKWLTRMSSDYYGKTAGLRNGVIDNLTKFIEGNYDPTASPQYAPIKSIAERQYQTGMDDVIANTPAGGALYEGMANLSGKKADTITDLLSTIIQDEYNKAYAMGQGSQQVAASGITNAGNMSTNLLNALANQQNAGASSMRNVMSLFQGGGNSGTGNDSSDSSWFDNLINYISSSGGE